MSLFKSTKKVEYCPECNSPLQIRRGKQGLFLGCSNYPQCQYLKPLQQTSHVIRQLEEICPQCGGLLQLKQGSFGIFIGCSHYPNCQFTVHDEPTETEEFRCPECKQHQLVARTGRSGKIFYGCAGYPTCSFTLPAKPVYQTCPRCQCELAICKQSRGKSAYLCANKQCRHLFYDENE